MSTVPPAMLNTRLALSPSTVSVAAPGPRMIRSSLMASSPLVRVMFPVTLPANVMAFKPALLLAVSIASRRVLQLVPLQAAAGPSPLVWTTSAPAIGVDVGVGVEVLVAVAVLVGVLVGVGVGGIGT